MIEAGQTVIKTRARKTVNTGRPFSVSMADNYDQQPAQYQLNENHGNQDDRSRFLKPLNVPSFNGDKQKFEDFFSPFQKFSRRVSESQQF